MKYLLSACLLLFFTPIIFAQQTQIRVLSQTADETVLDIEIGKITQNKVQTPQGTAVVVGFDKGTPWLVEGAPDIQKLAIPLLIPQQGDMQVEFTPLVVLEEPGVKVAPSKGNLKRNINPENVPYLYGEYYQNNRIFPDKDVALQTPFILRDARGQALWIAPVRYDAAHQSLITIQRMRVRLYKSAAKGENEAAMTTNRSLSRTYKQLYQKLFLNFDEKLLVQQRSIGTPEKMLVIVRDDLEGALTPLIAWKKQMGIHTTVVPLSEVGATNADMYSFVKNYYNEHGITYLLLVGDELAMPPLLRPGSIYSCDNCLGYMDGDDHFPEILVGRYHAATPEQLQLMVKRNLEYEKTPVVDVAANWCATGMASCSNEGAGIGDDNQADYEQSNEWKSKHIQDGFEKYWEFYDGNHTDISPTPGSETADKPGNPVSNDLVTVMNGREVSLYNYTGHGWEQGLVSGNFNVDAVAELRNEHRYPVIIAVACCAGNFTNGVCLGEAVQRAGNTASNTPYGAIAGYFSSDFQSWAPPMEGQDGMNQYLVDANGTSLVPVVSAMATYGNALMIAAYGTAGSDMADVWNPFCEPTFSPRTRLPQALTATHSPTIFLGSTTLAINSPVEGALISLYLDGQPIAVAPVANGVATLQFTALSNVGDIMVTGTQFNYLPYQGTVSIVPASGAYLVTQSIVLKEILGNNDQNADYSESIALDITLQNVGLVPALNALINLSSADSYINITDQMEVAGNIEDSTSLLLPAAFSFEILSGVPDGHIANFILDIEYSNGQVLSVPYALKINAPKVEIPTYSLVESANSDNDGRFESGETLVLTIKNTNSGHSTAPTAVGSISSIVPWLTVSAPVALGSILAGNTADAVFYIEIGAGAPQAITIDINYQLSAADYGNSRTITPVFINPIVENFESQNFTSFPWEMSGNKPWSITTTNPYSGTSCARSGLITHNQQSRMGLNLNILQDGNISFAARVGCEEDFDFLRFYMDGVKVGEWTGITPWTLVGFPVTTGSHFLEWTYEKDQFGTVQPDRVYVDEISLPPYEAVLVGTNVRDNTGFSATITPNPATAMAWLNLNLQAASDIKIDLSDGTGKQFYTSTSGQLPSGSHRLALPLQQLPAGLYMVQVRSEKGTMAYRLFVD